jgi:predicted site-specific integrase-resolvase
MSAVPSFFLRPQPPSPAVRRAKAKTRAKAVLTERERSAVVAYARASPAERKQMLRDEVEKAEKAKLMAERMRRKVYMRHYRAMKAMGTVIL